MSAVSRLTAVWIAMFFCGNLFGQPTNLAREDFWVPDGEVKAVIETNGVLYIGGIFDYVSPISETGNAFDLASGAALPGFPKVSGAIKAIVTDNAGGWFIGGIFTAVGGWPVTNLVHIRADRTVDLNWAPNPDKTVLTLALSRTMLYVGGRFENIAGEAHTLLAALDPVTGNAIPGWRADVTDISHGTLLGPTVNALALGDGYLFVGGYFVAINGVARQDVGSVDANTGALTPWHPNGYTGGEAGARIDALAFSENVLYVGGTFRGIGGVDNIGLPNVNRGYVAALDITKDLTASVLPWNPNASGPVTSLALSCDAVYIGGSFTNIGGQPRNRIAAVGRNSGLATAWNPNANGDVLSVTLAGNLVYAGGKFTQIGGQSREFLAALDIQTAQPTLWHPRADFGIIRVAVSGGSVVAGGALGPGGKLRKNTAAFDIRTGKPLDWNPQIGGGTVRNAALDTGVYALAASSNMIYFGGPFTEINGQARNHLGAVNAFSGVLSNWNPNANYTVEALLNFGGVIYVGGTFTNVGGQTRTNLAALDRISGAASTWAPTPDTKVVAFAGSGSTLYCGGPFSRIGGQIRKYLAGVSISTGAATACDANVSSQVSSIALLGNTLFCGGGFSAVTGQTRNRLAAIDLGTCGVTCWNPDAQGTNAHTAGINAVLASGNVVYTGGTFETAGGQPRNNLASLNTNCPATATSWNPNVNGSVNALAMVGGAIYAGGTFQIIGGQYHPSLAVFPPIGSPRITAQPLSQLASNGQPVTLTAVASGQTPLSYQWQFNGTNIPNATNTSFLVASIQATNAGEYTAVVTNALGFVTSKPATLTVIDPLSITTQPTSQTVAPGVNVTFTVVASGSPAPTYQWQLNGVNIPGAIYSSLTINNVQRTNGGSYSVVVANITGATNSAIATLTVTGPSLPFADNLAARGIIGGSSGQGSGNNQSATAELPSEPKHAGKPGGKSLWLGWTAPATGIATFHTRGSAIDTLLAIYIGTNFSAFTNIGSDEDRGGFGTSEVSFNTIGGMQYQIAVDGYAGASGNVLLTWSLDTTTAPFPRIYTQPLSASVTNGAEVRLSVQVNSDTPTSFQWFHECRALPGETNASLILDSVQPEDVGNYHVVVMNASSRTAQSEDAFVEIGPDPKALSKDKLEDLFFVPGGFALQQAGPAGAPSGGFLSVNSGTVGSQLFDNVGSATQQGEPIPCGVIGGSSKWMGFYVSTNAMMMIDTIGSSFDTVVAVYVGSSFINLSYVTCDNNSAPDRIRSRVIFTNAVSGTAYLVVIDGVNGAQGNVNLNWRLAGPPVCWSLSTNQTVPPNANVTLAVSMNNQSPDTLYFWRLNGSVISVGSSNSLLLPNIQPPQAGAYSVIVSNFAGITMTNVATINVGSPVQITATIFPTNNAKVFRLSIPSSDRFVIERTTNDIGIAAPDKWLPLYTNSSQQAVPIYFLDYASTNIPRSFYRIVAPR